MTVLGDYVVCTGLFGNDVNSENQGMMMADCIQIICLECDISEEAVEMLVEAIGIEER